MCERVSRRKGREDLKETMNRRTGICRGVGVGVGKHMGWLHHGVAERLAAARERERERERRRQTDRQTGDAATARLAKDWNGRDGPWDSERVRRRRRLPHSGRAQATGEDGGWREQAGRVSWGRYVKSVVS